MENERREISATQWVQIYRRFSSTDARWRPDTLQISAEENPTAEKLVCLLTPDNKCWFQDYKLLHVDRSENCAYSFAQYKQREGYGISLETTEF